MHIYKPNLQRVKIQSVGEVYESIGELWKTWIFAGCWRICINWGEVDIEEYNARLICKSLKAPNCNSHHFSRSSYKVVKSLLRNNVT